MGVAAAVNGRVPVIMDGGVRRGSDILKGLALGASVVCVGRPLLWALAAGGERGALLGFDILREELSTAMALSGVPSVADCSRELVRLPGEGPPPAPRL